MSPGHKYLLFRTIKYSVRKKKTSFRYERSFCCVETDRNFVHNFLQSVENIGEVLLGSFVNLATLAVCCYHLLENIGRSLYNFRYSRTSVR